jgi:hypothetical protein
VHHVLTSFCSLSILYSKSGHNAAFLDFLSSSLKLLAKFLTAYFPSSLLHISLLHGYLFWLENLKGRNRLEDLGIDGMIILEWILGKSGGKVWMDESGSG